MAKINVLSFEIANLIAAGEVVERPSSVLKELIENSIDSGATSIIAEIKRGGVALIRVTDNGCGIDKDDLPIALQRHATSKIRTKEDIDSIVTLGFRGEALAAISSVSEMTIISKTKDAPAATMLTASAGKVVDISEVGASDGTTVVVENLFGNVPARRKFLKKDATEAMNVAALVEKVALSHPEISIQLLIDGEERFKTQGDGDLYNTIYAVLGKDFAAKTLLSSFVYPLGISLFGRLTEPSALGGFFSLASGGYPQIAVMLSALFGGLLVGTGCAITFLGGGSTGGMDIVAFVLCRYFKRLKSSEAIFLLDTAVVLAGVLITKDAVLTLLGVITAFVGALAVDKIFLGASSAFSAHIVSERYEAINRAVIERLGRTTTLTDVVGGYTGRARKQVAVSFTRSEYSVLMGIVASLDKKAFVTIHRVHEIGGEGWKKLAD